MTNFIDPFLSKCPESENGVGAVRCHAVMQALQMRYYSPDESGIICVKIGHLYSNHLYLLV